MGRIKRDYCTENCTGTAEYTDHEIYGIQAGAMTPFGPMSDEFQIRCLKCGHERLETIPKVRKRKTTWPYYHEGVGVNFESESHEKKFAAANKLTKE